MRVILLWDYYSGYLPYFYKRHPGVKELPYKEQLQALQEDYFYWPPYLIPQFQANGHEAQILVGNSKPLQMAWARENDFPVDAQNWHFSIAQEQIRRARPDVLLVGGADYYLGFFLQQVAEYCRLVVTWKAIAFSQLDWSHVDCVLSSHVHFVERFRQLGMRSEQVLPCFEPKILDRLQPVDKPTGVCFVGSLSTVLFKQRLDLLSYLDQQVPLEIYGEKPDWRRRPLPPRLFLSQARFAPFLLRMKRHPAVYGLDMFRVLQRSKIALNVHVDSAGGLAGNIRMFEATGVGSLLLTETAPNLASLYQPDREVVTYASREEALEKIHYYLAHEQERAAIARAGQKRTLQSHNSQVRAREVLDIIERELAVKTKAATP